MNTACQQFRSLLEVVLEGGIVEQKLSELAWHEHLLACRDCRNILQAEEALEILLATLPEPKLPEHLVRRVVSRLRDARRAETRLDELLDLDRGARAPQHLAESVLARLRPTRERGAETKLAAAEAELDRLLDLDRELHAPSGLAARVLSGLSAERGLEAARVSAGNAHGHSDVKLAREQQAKFAPEFAGAPEYASVDGQQTPSHTHEPRRSWLRSPWVYAAAAGILVTFVGWAAWQRNQLGAPDHFANEGQPNSSPDGRSQQPGRDGSIDELAQRDGDKVAQRDGSNVAKQLGNRTAQRDTNSPPDAAMLAALDVLEQWDLLKSEDVDVLLSSSIDPADEALLEYQDMEAAGQPFNDKEPEPPSKG